MKISYTPTLADYRAGLRLHYRRKMLRRVTHLVGLWSMPLVVISFLISSIYRLATTGQERSPGEISWMLLALLFTLAIPASRYFAIRRQFRNIFPPSRADIEVTIDINEERIISSLPGWGEGKYFWNSILDFAQDQKATLLYVRKNLFLFFPTQAMSPAQQAELNQIIAKNLRRHP